jgi:cytochrome P450
MTVAEERPQIEAAVTAFSAYTQQLLDAKRADPGSDLISELVDRSDDVEILNLVLNVLVGGVDTTQAQLAHALRLFAAHPDQWGRLGDDPALAPQAVEEVVRFEPITPFTARIAMEDVSFRDVLFPKDTIVLVCAHTGNRDDLEDGHAFDITRPASKRVLTFGAGPHYCLGVNLAKAELQEALTYLAPRMRELTLTADPVYGTIDGIYGLDALRAAWT